MRFWRRLTRPSKNRILLLITSSLLVILAIGWFVFHLLQTESDYRHNVLNQIDRAESDFSNALMHLALSRDNDGPWQRHTGISLLQRSLDSYSALATTLKEQQADRELIQHVNALTGSLAEVVNSNVKLDADFRETIYLISHKADQLEGEISAVLNEERLEQRYLFTVTLGASVVFLTLLGIALVNSERIRSVLNYNLRRSEQRFVQLLQNTDDVFWMEEYASRRVLFVSPAFESISGMKPSTVLKQPQAWKKLIVADDWQKIDQARNAAYNGPQEIECRIKRMDGKTRWISGKIFPIQDPENGGETTRYIAAIVRDVTEKRELDHHLFQAQKMESLGQLTGGVAHDFNNLLTVILINARHLASSLSDNAKAERMTSLIARAAERGASLNQQLLAFASKQQLRPRRVDVSELVEESTEMLQRTIGGNYTLSCNTPDEKVWVNVDPGQLQNAIFNLCLNARDAMPSGGKVTLSLTYKQHEKLAAKDALACLTVTDTGVGIKAKNMDRVLEPFFTTKSSDQGTGLGLSMVFGFTRQSGGSLHIESEEGVGTSVHLCLPLSQCSNERRKSIQAEPVTGCALLIVEDDTMVRESTAAVLHDAGFRVLQAEDAETALAIFGARSDIRVLVTDVVMPGNMSGLELAQEIQSVSSTTRVLVVSGYIENGSPLELNENWRFLQKPFSDEALLENVSSLLIGTDKNE